jgi:CubicO group peptidase (beta-lactamase class C family)
VPGDDPVLLGASYTGCVLLRLAALLAAVLLGSAGSSAAPAPGFTWQKAAPDAVGLDAKVLGRIAAQARRGKSNCLVVVRDGKIAGEWYFRGTGRTTAQEVFSVTKSFTSTLVGIAQAEGKLRIGRSASTWIPRWRGTPAEAVTVRNLLSNDSGRQWSLRTDYVDLLQARDRTAFGIGLPQADPPRTVWAYNNAAIQTLEQVLQRAVGQDVAAFAAQRLFRPLGMGQTAMTRDVAGNPQVFYGLRSTCRDLARFGLLMLNGGRWGARQLVPAAWVREATGRSSTRLNAAYGYLWWLNRDGVLGDAGSPTRADHLDDPSTRTGRLVPGAPASTYWALGLGNQLIQVDPGSRTVVVRLGTAEAQPRPPTFGAAEASRVVTEAVVSR